MVFDKQIPWKPRGKRFEGGKMSKTASGYFTRMLKCFAVFIRLQFQFRKWLWVKLLGSFFGMVPTLLESTLMAFGMFTK